MTLYNLKKYKTFKTHCCQPHWLNSIDNNSPFVNGKQQNYLIVYNQHMH